MESLLFLCVPLKQFGYGGNDSGSVCSHTGRLVSGERSRWGVVSVFLPPEGVPEVPDEDEENVFDLGGEDYEEEEDEIDVEANLARLRKLARSSYPARTFQVGADELNELYTPTYKQRLQQVLHPDEAFGVVFTWNAIFRNARMLTLESWTQVAEEEGLVPPTMQDIIRAEEFVVESAIERIFRWTADWKDIKRLVFRQLEIFNKRFDSYEFELVRGCAEWLKNIERYGMRCCLCSSNLSEEKVRSVLERTDLARYFPDVISVDDEVDDFGQSILQACERIERPPYKTVVFCDSPADVIAAHEMQMKAVAILGAYKAYDMRISDANIRGYDELGVYNVRRLFAEDGDTFGPELQTEMEVETQ